MLNAFTPYGDCSLTQIANLYANVVQRYRPTDLGVCSEMITERAATLMRLGDYSIKMGKAADPVIWDEELPADIIAKYALPRCGFKHGRRIFSREAATLHRP